MYIRRVRSVLQILSCVSAVAVLGLPANASVGETSPGQYHVIPERNVFGLRPPPAQPNAAAPQAPLPKITLTGITTILGNKRALMKVAPSHVKPGEPAKEESLILTEGQREGEVEVLQIDEHAGSVKVNNSGTVMTLTFEKDGVKVPATPAPRMAPPLPNPLPGGPVPNPYLPAAAAVGKARTLRVPGFGASGPATGPAPAGAAGAPGGTASGAAGGPSLADQQLSAEEQAIISAFERQENATTPGNNPASYPVPPLPTLPTAVQLNGPPGIAPQP